MNTIRLEYSHTLGQFNLARATDRPAKKGFETLCRFMNPERANRFVEQVTGNYPCLRLGSAVEQPDLKAMKEELIHFLEEDIRLLNEQMRHTYQRRKDLFTNK